MKSAIHTYKHTHTHTHTRVLMHGKPCCHVWPSSVLRGRVTGSFADISLGNCACVCVCMCVPLLYRAETLLPDRTGKYAAIGALLGVFFGWAAQFF